MKTITTIEYTGNIANNNYKKYRITSKNCTTEFVRDFDQLLNDLKPINYDGFIIHPRMKLVEIYSNPKSEPNPQLINTKIIKNNPNFNYLGSGDTT